MNKTKWLHFGTVDIAFFLIFLAITGFYGNTPVMAESAVSFKESWNNAKKGTYQPKYEALSTVKGDEGSWYIGATVDGHPSEAECGPTPHRVEIIEENGNKKIKLTANNSYSGCANNLWIDWEKGFEGNSKKIPITPDTRISFKETGKMLGDPDDDDGWTPDNCGLGMPCGIYLCILASNGTGVFYRLQYPTEAEENLESTFITILLDEDAGAYDRNLYDDFMEIPDFNPSGAYITGIIFEIGPWDDSTDMLGWGILDDLTIGESEGQTDSDTIDNDGDGYTENQGDFDDGDATVYPGAIEICGDGIDQDCNGSDLSCGNPPAAPTGVAASDGTLSGKVQVTWNPSTGATSCDVYRADMPAWAGGIPKRIATSIIGTAYDDASAVNGSRYYYWVKAKNSGGGSGYSMFDPGYWGSVGSIPPAPTNVSATDGTGSGTVAITWTSAPNALVYEIYRADIPVYLGGSIKNIGTSTTTSYNDTTVVNGNQYYYWVKSRNSWGGSGYSKFDTGYIGTASSLLPAPTGVSATDGTVSGKVKLTWNAVSGSLIYEVWRATQPAYLGGKPALMGTVKNNGLSYDDAAITCGQTYYYWVKSRSSWGSSGYSSFDSGYCTGP